MFAEMIQTLQKSNSKIFKETKLKEFGSKEPLFIRLLHRTYNPEYVYGIKKIPEIKSYGNKTLVEIWPQVEKTLDSLTSREITGNVARNKVAQLMSLLQPEEAKIFENILKGDLRCGINVRLINNCFPGTIPEYPYMRCSLMKNSNIDQFEWKKGIFSQIKADGMFVNIFFNEDRTVKIASRNGSIFPNSKFENFIQEFVKIAKPGYCYHGELLVLEEGKNKQILPRKTGNGILNSVLKGGSFEKNQRPFSYFWDCVKIANMRPQGKDETPYFKRFQLLKDFEKKEYFDLIPYKMVYSLEEAQKHYFEIISEGLEGTVIKNPLSPWIDGTSKDQIKMKIEAEVDLIVRGFNPGKGKNEKTFGSLICESSDGLIQVNVSGFNDKDRERITKEIDEWIDRKIITVRANSLIINDEPPHRLFLPRFVEERLDKIEADSFEKIVQIFNGVMKGDL